jgi:hypothetical protein
MHFADNAVIDVQALSGILSPFHSQNTISAAEAYSRSIMPDQRLADIELLRAAYAAFNGRDIDTALATMAPDVAWPKAFKGGFASGHQEVRIYWTEQWSEINPRVEPISFHPEADGLILVHVHQVVRDLAGALVVDGLVGHRFKIDSGLIRMMEVCPLPPYDSGV